MFPESGNLTFLYNYSELPVRGCKYFNLKSEGQDHFGGDLAPWE